MFTDRLGPGARDPAGSLAAMSTSGDRPTLQRDAIVAAARELVATFGLEALSLRRLAATLDVTAPALYAHVTDKHDLLRAVAEGQFDLLVTRYQAVHVADPVERIRAHCRAYVSLAQESPELFRVMFLYPPDLGDNSELPESMELPGATRAFNIAAEAVAEAIAAGAVVSDDPLLTALTLWAGVHGVANVLLLGFGLPPELEDALIAEITDRTLRGYAP